MTRKALLFAGAATAAVAAAVAANAARPRRPGVSNETFELIDVEYMPQRDTYLDELANRSAAAGPGL